jgi:hypothetical protein
MFMATRWTKRVLAISILAVVAIVPSAPAAATGDQWNPVFVRNQYGNWEDDRCSSSGARKFKVKLFEHTDYDGEVTVVCGSIRNFDDVPMDGLGGSANGRVSSADLAITYVSAGDCAVLHENSNFGGGPLKLGPGTSHDWVGGDGWNDVPSSIEYVPAADASC